MSEAALWSTVRTKIGPFGHVVRHENSVGPGTPDVSYTINGVSGWVELKQLDEEPSRAATPLVIPHLTKEQVEWAKAEAAAGGRCWMLLKVSSLYLLTAPDVMEQVYLRALTVEGVATRAKVVSRRGFPTGDVLRCLVL